MATITEDDDKRFQDWKRTQGWFEGKDEEKVAMGIKENYHKERLINRSLRNDDNFT